jgi:integrase
MRKDRRDPRDHNLWQSPGGMIYFKLAIPAEVRERFPPNKAGKVPDRITESLGTDSWVDARVLRDQRLAHYQRVFARMATGAALSPEEVATERRRVHRGTLQALLVEPPAAPIPEEERLFEAMQAVVRARRPMVEPGIRYEVMDEARRIADEKFGPGVVANGSPEWNEICQHVAAAKARALEDYLVSMLRGEPVEPPAADVAHGQHLPAPTVFPNGNGKEPFSVALGHYIADLEKNGKRETTIRDFKAMGVRFVEFANDPVLASVTIDNAKDFLKKLEADGLGAATINKHHWLCKAVFEHARTERRRFSGDNPFEFSKKEHKKKSKAKYTIDDLRALFTSTVFTGRQVKPRRYDADTALPWAALVSLYTGAGREEICQLRPGDVRQENGTWLFHIAPEAALADDLKRDARERKVPVHSELKRLGLLKYLAALPRGAERLFPNLPVSNAKPYFGEAVGKRFREWRESVGVARPGEKLDFHSFRHTVAKMFEDIGVRQNDAARVLGHSVEGISYGVYSAPEVKRLAQIVERIKYKGLRIK